MVRLLRRVWHSQYRIPLLIWTGLIPYLAWKDSHFLLGLVSGFEGIFIAAWMGEQWPHKFKRFVDPSEGSAPVARWLHRKRGSMYEEIGRGLLQVSSPGALVDGAPIVLYRCELDGTLWARWEPEFEDGRFEKLG